MSTPIKAGLWQRTNPWKRTKPITGRLRQRIAELREQLAGLHRESAIQHQEGETVSVSLAVLDERRRSLANSIEALRAELQSLAGERDLAGERLRDLEQAVSRAEEDSRESAEQLKSAQSALESRQTGRGGIESRLQEARDRLTGLHASRAEAQARLDALAAQLEYHATRIATAKESVRQPGRRPPVAERRCSPQPFRERESERHVEELRRACRQPRGLSLTGEAELREAQSARDSLAANQSKLSAQLEVLDQAEQTLSGYAEGARFLLDPGRQSRLQVRGSFSGMLQVPAELETAIAAALGDAVDTVLLETEQHRSSARNAGR